MGYLRGKGGSAYGKNRAFREKTVQVPYFTGCTLRCVFCQNHEIAAGKRGQKIDESHLAEIFLKLQQQKANNINLVTPTQYVLPIIAAVKKQKRRD